MQEILKSIRDELQGLVANLQSAIPEHGRPLNVARSSWSFPGVSSEDIRVAVVSLIETIDLHEESKLDEAEQNHLRVFPEAIQYARNTTVQNIWDNGQHAIPALFVMFDALRRALARSLRIEPDEVTSAALSLRQVRGSLRALELSAAKMSPRSAAVEEKISRIEKAHDAAERLPADLEQLEDAQRQVKAVLADAQECMVHIKLARSSGDETAGLMKGLHEAAQVVVDRCDSAYAAATSQGLAAAFTERSTRLSYAVIAWVAGLIVALAIGGWLGHVNAAELSELLLKDAPVHVVATRAFMSIVALVGPVWFAWLATKQINQNFRLSEDYGFKASISRAYEGYRKEAARIGGGLESTLLKSALDRLDELPLRLVESSNHGSPWQEMLSSEVVKDAMRTIPGFAGSVIALAKSTMRGAEKKEAPSAP